MEIPIESFALRRKLSQDLNYRYKDWENTPIWTEFTKKSNVFEVHKFHPSFKTDKKGKNLKE